MVLSLLIGLQVRVMLGNQRHSIRRVFTIEYILCLALTGAAPLSAQKPTDPSDRNCSVKGKVTDASSGEPLRKAFVRLEPSSGKGATSPGVTDDGGKFAIQDVTPGTYQLVAEKQGYLDGRYGGLEASVELRLSASDNLIDLNISLTPQAVISGRVLDDDGEPWAHAVASIYRSVWKKGKRQLEGFNSQDPDDQGGFRIAQLPPGRYYIAAIPDSSWETRNRATSALRNLPTWYPSSPNAQSATAVILNAGEEQKGIDIRIRRGAFFHIRGKLTGLNQIPASNDPEPFSRPRLSAVRVSDRMDDSTSYSANLRPDGAFEFPAVPSGMYEILVSRGFMSAVAMGHATVQVDDKDVDNVSIDLAPPHPLKGAIQIEGGGAFDPSGLRVDLESVDGLSAFLPATVRSDGGFDFAQVGSEQYRVRLRGTGSAPLYLKRLRYGHTESQDGTFSATTEEPLTLILSTRGARVTGTVKKADEGGARPEVVLIPDTGNTVPREYGTRVAVFDQYGTFALDSIAPGAYHLYAFENVPEGSWGDAELLREISDKGVALHFEEGDAERIEVPLIRHSDLAALLARLGIE